MNANIFADTYQEYSNNSTRNKDRETILGLFLRQPSKSLQNLLSQAMNEALINRVILMIDKYEQEKDEMACLKMLICTISPIVQGMQTSLRQYIKNGFGQQNQQSFETTNSSFSKSSDYFPNEFEHFLKYFPTRQKYLENTDECEQIYAKFCAKNFTFKHQQ